MDYKYIYASLTRISDLREQGFAVKSISKKQWETGDYVICKITDPGSNTLNLELPSGRMRGVIGGEYLIGALGERFATLEATGSWRKVGKDFTMHVLTGAGLIGKLTSKSAFIPNMMEVVYVGHAHRNGRKLNMLDFVNYIESIPFQTPVILFMGTSMSAGKTTSARIVTHLFKMAGYKVAGAKLTGAGRYKDILAIKDVGADSVVDFVDVGLPSSICPTNRYQTALEQMLTRIQHQKADIAIIEIGASPLELYNGATAFQAIREQIKAIVLAASDPYAVHGLMKAFDVVPDLVTGIASNTLAGTQMVKKLCGVRALNFLDGKNTGELKGILMEKTGFSL
jgi:hypothetical protein